MREMGWSRGRGLGWGRGVCSQPEAEAERGRLLSPEGVMGMMQTQPKSKSLALTRTSAAKEPPPGSAPPLVPRTRGRRECKSYLARKKKEKKRAVPRKRGEGWACAPR